MRRAVVPRGELKVGAALWAEDGGVFAGCNVVNKSLTLVTCAERVALLNALSHGARHFHRIAVVSSRRSPCPPCGVCRQMLLEFAPSIEVVMIDLRARLVRRSLIDLMPMAFLTTEGGSRFGGGGNGRR